MSKNLCFRVAGTKCASCEILLEREIRKLPGVISARVSHAKKSVSVQLLNAAELSIEQLQQIGGENYRFSPCEAAAEERRRGGYGRRLAGVLALVFGAYWLASRFGLLTFAPDLSGGRGLGAVLVIGLVAAFSSCTAVLSGLLIAISTQAAKDQSVGTWTRLRPHLLFNVGRLSGFALFGAGIGYVGSIFTLSPAMNGLFIVVVALVMLGLGLNLLELWPGHSLIRLPKSLVHKIHDLKQARSPWAPFILGALTFFLPCGFTQGVQLLAIATGSPTQAAAYMFVFALGTLPALLGFGAASSFFKGRALGVLTKTAGVAVIVLALANFQNGFALLGYAVPAQAEKLVAIDVAAVGDEQVIQMEVTRDFTYAPEVLTVVQGVPVRWEIYGSERMGCADTLVSRGLRISTRLKPGLNEVTFTPQKVGEFVFSCSMGMIRGTMRVVPKKS